MLCSCDKQNWMSKNGIILMTDALSFTTHFYFFDALAAAPPIVII